MVSKLRRPSSDEIGMWSEIKLQIIKEYAAAYALIMAKQPWIKHFAYIDGFAGAGTHISRISGKEVMGSPAIALETIPPFSHHHFIDLDGGKIDELRALSAGRKNVSVYAGDCNEILLESVFPRCLYKDFRRALCLLDPYDLNPNWEVVQTAGRMKSIEIFLNFMISDANRNILWNYPEEVPPSQIRRLNAFWGDESWRKIAYEKTPGLFENMKEKAENRVIAEAYRDRLRHEAGFKYVPDPIPMRNSKGSIVYYLYFASQNEAGGRIARAIFDKYRRKGLIYGG